MEEEVASNLFYTDLVVPESSFHVVAVAVLEVVEDPEVEAILYHMPLVVVLHAAHIVAQEALADHIHIPLLAVHLVHSTLAHTLELLTSSWCIFLSRSDRLFLRTLGLVVHILPLQSHCIVEILQNVQLRKVCYHVVFVEMVVEVDDARDRAGCTPMGVDNLAQLCRNLHRLIDLEFAALIHQSLLYFEFPSLFVVVEILLKRLRCAFSFRRLVAMLRGRLLGSIRVLMSFQ